MMGSSRLPVWGADSGTYQVAFIEKQQHMLMPGIPLEVVLQILTPCAERIPGIQDLQEDEKVNTMHCL
jgi:hypothetical protein